MKMSRNVFLYCAFPLLNHLYLLNNKRKRYPFGKTIWKDAVYVLIVLMQFAKAPWYRICSRDISSCKISQKKPRCTMPPVCSSSHFFLYINDFTRIINWLLRSKSINQVWKVFCSRCYQKRKGTRDVSVSLPRRKAGLRILHNEHLFTSIGNRFFDTVIDSWIPCFDVYNHDSPSNIDSVWNLKRG